MNLPAALPPILSSLKMTQTYLGIMTEPLHQGVRQVDAILPEAFLEEPTSPEMSEVAGVCSSLLDVSVPQIGHHCGHQPLLEPEANIEKTVTIAM